MLRKALLFRFAALSAALAATAVPATAGAASISVKGKCYVSYPGSSEKDAFSEPIPVEVEEVTPGREVRLTLEVKGVITSSSPLLTVPKSGNLSTSLDAWITGMDDGPTKAANARMVLRDFWLGTELGSASLQVANVGFYVTGGLLDVTLRRRWIVSGLSQISNRNGYYVHYFVDGHQTTSMYLGKTQDRCGFLRTNKVIYPGSPSNVPDEFDARLQASAKFRPNEPYVPMRWTVTTQAPPANPTQ